ncbi:MAG: single-stranded-DNA-specific exonuclease RecJ [Chloroflexi bacterium]|nr:single-stranded-DNA-specific exonuclease RecJ [Chloroflexota bacterium]
MKHRRWKILPGAPAKCLAGTGLPPLVTQLLHNRGIIDPVQARAFLGDEAAFLHLDPFLLPDMHKAVARIHQALLSGESMAVYGDFDADGVCGTALLVGGLALLGGSAIPYIPHRVQEGYGLNDASLDSLAEQGVTLVITVDCGTGNAPEVEHARNRGLDIIVTDHHTVSQELPAALAVVNPKRADSVYPFAPLAGVGVAFKLLEALFHDLGKQDLLDDLLDIVAIGSVADMVPLLGENRYLVKKGLKVLSRTRRLGLQEMMRVAGVQPQDVTSERVSWTIAPRINAPGRLDTAVASYELLMTDSLDVARRAAEELERTNEERQRLTSEVFARAREEVSAAGADAPILIVGGEGYAAAVAGLVAGRLAEEFYRPAVVLEIGEGGAKGSARSIPEFDMVSALAECRDVLLRFGGHPMAAGFALQTENLGQFRQRMLDVAARQLSAVDLRPSLTVEADMPLSAINSEVLKLVEKFAPFGSGNPVPVFLSRRVKVLDCAVAGNGAKHLKLKLKQKGVVWRSIGFDLGHLAAEVTPEVDLVYSLTVDRWGGQEMLSLNVLDFAPAQ